jgi:hypothetical protein
VQVRIQIIDDCSPDDTPAVCELLRASDSRVEFHRHAANKGHIATYNEGLSAARADYVVLLSADDLLTPGALARATAVMEQEPSVGFVYGRPVTFYGDLPAPRQTATRPTLWKGVDWIAHMCRSGKNFINSPEVVMRTRVQHEIGGYRPELPHSGDMEMWLRAAAVSDVGHVNGADQAYYRVHKNSMQRTIHAGALRDFEGRHAAFESVLANSDMPAAKRLLSVARHSVASDVLKHARRICELGLQSTESIVDYREFALSIAPEIRGTRHWRALDRLSLHRPEGLNGLELRLAEGAHKIKQHLEWRRWSRTGVY